MAIFDDAPVVPLVQANDPNVAIKTAEALVAGGLKTIEVVLRTEAAFSCMEAIINNVEGVTVGAGTVLNTRQAEKAVSIGAKFIVSPGLDDAVVSYARENAIDVFPGVMTPSELIRAANLGLSTVKFFPASLAGGPPMLKALSSVFRQMRFMPTGGISASNLADYLALPAVVACGGSWLTPADDIAEGNYDSISRLAAEALQIAASAKS